MGVDFDDPSLVANAGLILAATMCQRLGLGKLIDDTVQLDGRVGGAMPGRKVLTLIDMLIAGGPTSTTPTCCEPERPDRCWGIG